MKLVKYIKRFLGAFSSITDYSFTPKKKYKRMPYCVPKTDKQALEMDFHNIGRDFDKAREKLNRDNNE